MLLGGFLLKGDGMMSQFSYRDTWAEISLVNIASADSKDPTYT
jgi:hypothetical protein